MESYKSWLFVKKLLKTLWVEGMAYAVNVLNQVSLTPNNMKSPYELNFEENPNIKHFKVLCSPYYVHILISKRSKMDVKSKKCIFIRYDERKKG